MVFLIYYNIQLRMFSFHNNVNAEYRSNPKLQFTVITVWERRNSVNRGARDKSLTLYSKKLL